MSGRIVGEVLNHAPADLRGLDLLVLVSLAETAHDKDRTASTGDQTAEAIAYRVRSTPSSVRNALARLRARGLIRPLHATVGPGKAQNWVIPRLSDHHREGATVTPINHHERATGE